ncbi:hypothetical protein TNCV_3977521 [Trichonephila clavipes]|nr:hypothetical protein TNCV_3977521 [Trichonephila clavipes]
MVVTTQDDSLQSLWLQRMPPHIQTVLSASSEPWINWLSSLIRFLRLLVRPRLSVRPQLFLHHPSHLHAVLSQQWTPARQIQELSLQAAELKESAIPLATNDIVLTAGDHITLWECQ